MSKQEYDDAKLVAAIERDSRSKTNQDVIAAADRQMQRWLLAHQGQESAAAVPNAGSPTGIGPYLTISREAGAGGSRVARLIGETIGWEVFDRELLECLAERYHTSLAALERVDETPTNWFVETFGKWIDPASVSQVEYVFRLGRVILVAARAGKVIFVGRGANSSCRTIAVCACG